MSADVSIKSMTFHGRDFGDYTIEVPLSVDLRDALRRIRPDGHRLVSVVFASSTMTVNWEKK